MKSNACLFFAAFWMCCAVHYQIAAQTERFSSRYYSMKDGLPADGINCLLQDSRGFIWVGTYSGLSKFDGYNFTTFKANATNLRNNVIHALWEDKRGRLWVGHMQGIDVFDPETEKVAFHWPNSESINDDSVDVQVLKLRARKNGKLWICTNNGVYVADPETLSIERFTKIPEWEWNHDIGETKDGHVVSASNIMYHIDAQTGETWRYIRKPLNPRSVCIDKSDRVWIGSDTGLDLFDPRTKSLTHFNTSEVVLNIFENGKGKLILGCRDGIYSFEAETGVIIKVSDTAQRPSVMIDRQGILWLLSLQGLQQFTSNSKNFLIHRQFGQLTGSIVQDKNNDVWILGSRGHVNSNSLFKFNPRSGITQAFQSNPKDRHSHSANLIRSLFGDKDGIVWLASPRLLERYNPENKTFHRISIDGTSNADHKRNLIDPLSSFMNSDGMVWVGDWNGVSRLDPITGSNERIQSFPETTVHSFAEDSNHNLWIGSTAGLSRYNLKTGRIDLFKNDPADAQSLSDNTVYHLMIDAEKNIWIGTGGGLNKIVKGTENGIPKFINWRSGTSGLPNDDVYCIVDGGDGTLWLACGNMISHFYPDRNYFRTYDHNDGLSGKTFRGLAYSPGKGLRTDTGKLYFGSTDGLVIFDPDSLEENPFIPPVVITHFSINDLPVPIEGTYSDTVEWKTPLAKAISYTDKIQLSHQQNDFTFEFAALNFVNPERNQYRYKLEPYETRWIETTAANRIARYTNISPGRYIFRVIGSNNDGIWNEEGTSLVIVITPPWWQTSWAYTLYGIILIGMFLYWRSYENKRLILKHRAEHLSELDNLKSRFFANISHEFRTPITLILGPLKKFYNKASAKDEKEEFGTMMRNGQRLLRLINQLLDLSKVEAGKMKLQTTPVDLVQFLKEIASFYESMAIDKKIKFFFYAEVQELIVSIDQEKMEKVVHNLLSNAFKFTREGGEIILNLKAEDKQCVIVVKDTGIGIPPDQLNKVFDRFYQVDNSQTRGYEGSGLGMALAKELVELHHGTISVESTEGNGSTFTVRLPLGKENLSNDEIIDSTELKTHTVSDVIISEDSRIEISVEKETVSTESQPVLLIVEDNMDMRHFIRKILSDQYQIIEAVNGKSGVKMAEESVPDLIISDIMMPEMDGYKLCERIKSNELTSHIPVILLTAKADRESKLTGLEIGADDYLSKPFDADELKLIVRNHIEERRRMRERFGREITLEPKQISITSLDEKLLIKILAIIEAHIDDENFSIDALSREAGYSNMHFYRKIKALSGQTPSQFLRTIRLKRAAELLSKNSDNVTQIAYSVGFGSLSYFNKCFKEQFGVTPGQFGEEKSKV